MSKKTNVPVSIRNRMEKIYTYIKYCQRLEDAYRTKHEEWDHNERRALQQFQEY